MWRRLVLAALLVLGGSACGSGGDHPDGGTIPDGAPDGAPDVDAAPARWAGGPVDVTVLDPDGDPVAQAIVLTGGSLDWVLTDEGGRATVQVGDDGVTDRFVIAARRGWRIEGTDLEETAAPRGAVSITIAPLPPTDNAAYLFGEGGDSSSPNTLYCGHCHREIADGWNTSGHHGALSNPRTRDLWNGTALSILDEPSCSAAGGRWQTGARAGAEAGTEAHCYLERGVLPDLNEGCGHAAQLPCDHRDVPPETLENLGHCGDCHGAAIPGAQGGRVNLNDAAGATFDEGISCDLCHKIEDVTVGPAPGLDGAIHLKRPSEPSPSPLTEYEPIMFGPYPDVLNPFMGASYQPQFRTGELCSGCHEFAQEPLRREDEALLDRSRWPDGLPVHSTYGEWAASAFSPDVACQACHMPALDLDTAIGNLEGFGLGPGIAAGWLRAPGEIRAHTFVGPTTLAADAVDLRLTIEEVAGTAEVTATLSNLGAGHAVPTGEPMRRIVVLVTATIDGVRVPPTGGEAVPDVGGSLVQGTVGVEATFDGGDLVLSGGALDGVRATAVRIVRPTGDWIDYPGPGVGWFSDPLRTPQDKGARLELCVDEIPIVSLAGDTVTLERAPRATAPGDRVYVVGADQWAGAAGSLYSKILVDAQGVRGVPHYRAVDVASDDRIPPQGERTSVHVFPAPAAGQELVVTARVIYRRANDAVAQEFSWPHDDLELLTVDRRLAH